VVEGKNVRRHSCTRCGRALKDPVSVSASMGPVCRRKLGLKPKELAKVQENRSMEEWLP
jgi:hypothetical protein